MVLEKYEHATFVAASFCRKKSAKITADPVLHLAAGLFAVTDEPTGGRHVNFGMRIDHKRTCNFRMKYY
jgi:hypothetical protein